MSATRKTLYCVTAAVLAWSHLLVPSGTRVVKVLVEAGWPNLLWWLVLMLISEILPTALFVLGCWLVWRVERSYGSGYQRLPVALGAVQVASTVAYVSFVRFDMPAQMQDIVFGISRLLAAILTVASLIALFEPYTSVRLCPSDRRKTTVITILVALLFLAIPSGRLAERMFYYVGIASLFILRSLGITWDYASVPALVLWGTWLCYLIVRTAIAWRASKKTRAALEPESRVA